MFSFFRFKFVALLKVSVACYCCFIVRHDFLLLDCMHDEQQTNGWMHSNLFVVAVVYSSMQQSNLKLEYCMGFGRGIIVLLRCIYAI